MMFDEQVILNDDQLERLAELIATKMVGMRPAGKPMLTVDDIATTFQVSRAWVYENARRLGAIKIGPGERAPLRFDPDLVASGMRRVGDPADGPMPKPGKTRPAHKRPNHLLPVYDG